MRKERNFSTYSREFFYVQLFFVNCSQKYSVFRFWSGNRRTFHCLFSLSPKVIHNQNRFTPWYVYYLIKVFWIGNSIGKMKFFFKLYCSSIISSSCLRFPLKSSSMMNKVNHTSATTATTATTANFLHKIKYRNYFQLISSSFSQDYL